jgi:hypothetical protein
MSPPRTLGTVYEAKLFLVMPGANALTREITATILARDGLIDAQDTVPVPSSAAVRRKSAPYRAQAAALRDIDGSSPAMSAGGSFGRLFVIIYLKRKSFDV